ncbi:PepSY domain-containing protein [Clostridium sp. BJN0013]|uniref:PepSY domain-containing protein n=1 Tax=Clostridium sp. BJN0013 TaxID=3236840 RepID=UPI0034C65C25
MIGYFYNLWDGYWRNYRIDTETAVQIALQRVPGQLIKIEVDMEDGFLTYEISIRSNDGLMYEVKMDANTGEILEVDRND